MSWTALGVAVSLSRGLNASLVVERDCRFEFALSHDAA